MTNSSISSFAPLQPKKIGLSRFVGTTKKTQPESSYEVSRTEAAQNKPNNFVRIPLGDSPKNINKTSSLRSLHAVSPSSPTHSMASELKSRKKLPKLANEDLLQIGVQQMLISESGASE
jgi:hypothetical protein